MHHDLKEFLCHVLFSSFFTGNNYALFLFIPAEPKAPAKPEPGRSILLGSETGLLRRAIPMNEIP